MIFMHPNKKKQTKLSLSFPDNTDKALSLWRFGSQNTGYNSPRPKIPRQSAEEMPTLLIWLKEIGQKNPL